MKKLKKLLLVGLVATSLVACGKTTENKNQAPEVKEPEKIVYYTPLTHEERDNEDQSKKKIFPVMLDNHDDARPQAQISKADISMSTGLRASSQDIWHSSKVISRKTWDQFVLQDLTLSKLPKNTMQSMPTGVVQLQDLKKLKREM